MNREFLLLAQDFDPDKHHAANHFISIKLDGQRALWDGGVSRGILKEKIPWANINKDQRYKEPPVATGLWSRYGNVIHAPGWFLDKLPKGIILDGELYLGRGRFQECRSIVSTLVPGPKWKGIIYKVFDMPSINAWFQSGKINNPNFSHYIDEAACEAFLRDQMTPAHRGLNRIVDRFDKTMFRMEQLVDVQNEVWSFLKQHQLSSSEDTAREILYQALDDETSKGGEGLILRAPSSLWVPKRVNTLLKVKKFLEGEGVVVGYVSGEGKLLGMLGALRIQANAKVFNLSGFNNMERTLSVNGREWASANPKCIYPGSDDISICFKYGDTIRYRYMTLTDEGQPREPRYFR